MVRKQTPDADVDWARVALATALAETQGAVPTTTMGTGAPGRSMPGARTAYTLERLRRFDRSRGERVLELGDPIGEGGMGLVRMATQPLLGRVVAAKTLREDVEHDALAHALLREAWITGRLEHPNIVPIYDLLSTDTGLPLVVMRRIEGQRWSDVMRDADTIRASYGALDPEEWNLRTFLTVCNAVGYAHNRGILHRDIKPDNVMLGPFGEVYLLDWGISLSISDDDDDLPKARDATDVAGTPAYMAPESLDPVTYGLGPWTDIYLLGATLFEVVVGIPPHADDTMAGVIAKCAISDPEFPKDTPQELIAIIRHAMARDPRSRHPTVEALRRSVEEFLEHRNSIELCERADGARNELDSALRDGEPEARILEILSRCRTQYESALAIWPDNSSAKGGLDSALCAIAEAKLAEGDALAAARWLRECRHIPDDLNQRVRRAALAAEKLATRAIALHRKIDTRPGTRVRVAAVSLLALVGVLAPIGARISGERPTYAQLWSVFGILIVFLVGIAWWAPPSLRQMYVNRQIYLTLVATLGLEAVLSAIFFAAGMEVERCLALLFACRAMAMATLCVWLDRRIVPSLVACIGAAAISLQAPQYQWLAQAMANAVMGLNILVVRNPRPLAGTHSDLPPAA